MAPKNFLGWLESGAEERKCLDGPIAADQAHIDYSTHAILKNCVSLKMFISIKML
jgi:hypothetical protein